MSFTEAELIERQGFLGASEASAALGLSSWFTRLQLYQSKVGKGEPIEQTVPMMVGSALEPVTLALFERETGHKVTRRQDRVTDRECPWRRATIDGFIEAENAVVEAKTSGDFRGWGMGDDEIPLPYLYNIHHTFACMPTVETAYFPVLVGGRTYKTYEVHRDDSLVNLVRQGEDEFMDYVRAKTPPPAANDSDLKILYPRDYGKQRIASAEEAMLIQRLKDIKAQIKALEKDADTVGVAVKSAFADYAALMDTKGAPLATWKAQTENRIDVERLRGQYAAVAAECTKTNTIRKLLIK
jgi:putative phage-type endonuclease